MAVLIPAPAFAQSAARAPPTSAFCESLNASVEELTARVSLSVVQVLVTGYGPVDEPRAAARPAW